jgi:hypothetical protein
LSVFGEIAKFRERAFVILRFNLGAHRSKVDVAARLHEKGLPIAMLEDSP